MLRRTLLLTAIAALGVCQEQPPPGEPQYEFVSGTISELAPPRLVVNRAVVGKSPENHTFLLTADTKVEGTLRVNARVTVGYRTNDQGEAVAMRVIVRPTPRGKQ
jgi:hypothetical protein